MRSVTGRGRGRGREDCPFFDVRITIYRDYSDTTVLISHHRAWPGTRLIMNKLTDPQFAFLLARLEEGGWGKEKERKKARKKGRKKGGKRNHAFSPLFMSDAFLCVCMRYLNYVFCISRRTAEQVLSGKRGSRSLAGSRHGDAEDSTAARSGNA